MNALVPRPIEPPDVYPFTLLLEEISTVGLTFSQRDASLCLRGAVGDLPAEMQQRLRTYKAELLAICALRADAAKISETILRLRCEDPPKGRAHGLRYVGQQIEKLAARCPLFNDTGEPCGWPDSDPFAEDAVTALRLEFAELTAEGNPYPLGPLDDDPFGMDPPRLYSGKLA